MNYETLEIDIQGNVANITLNRPEVRNAMNFRMVEELYALFTDLKPNRDIRAIVLSGAGGVFCAGGDIKEMRSNTVPSIESGGNLDNMLNAVNHAPQIVIAKVEGAALGGGLGLVCVSDIAIASTTAKIGLPEVRLGITPAFISPYVLQRIGLTRTRELMLTGRRFNGEEALAYGLVHHVAEPKNLNKHIYDILREIQYCAPEAIAATKELLFAVHNQPTEDTVEYRANLLNRLRSSEEGQEGMLSFIEKRSAKWVVQGEPDAPQ
jgi:isohexenylglutaconyl-CoA hydratase